MKTQTHPIVKAHLLRGACYLLLFLAVGVIPLGFGQRPMSAPSPKDNPTGFVCMGCPPGITWRPGPDMPSTAVRTVGVYFWPNGKFYVVGGRSMDGVGNDFTHPFEFNGGWSIKSATYPDNQVSNMACGILADSGTNYIYCVGGSAGGQTTATDRVFRYNPVTDTIETIPSPWPGDADGITLPGGFVAFNNKLYILGGFRINTEMIDTIWEFTPGTNTWVQKAAHLPVPLGYIPTTAIFNLIYTGGGSTWDGTTIHDSNYSFVYDPVADSISTIANIPRATGETRALTFAPLGNTDYEMWVMGGGRDAPNPSSEIDTYEVVFHRGWSTFGHFLTPRRNFATDGTLSCFIYLAGGYASDGVTPLRSMELFCFPAPTATVTATATPTLSPTGTPTATHTPPLPRQVRELLPHRGLTQHQHHVRSLVMKKKDSAQFGSFSLQLVLCSAALCSMITGTLLAFFHPEAPAKSRMPTFAERVTYQRAIEEVYWRHRISPTSNASAKPPLDKVMSHAEIAKKIEDYMRDSQALEDYWQRPITPDQLQAEIERMASHTKQPKVLRELFDALGNDPFVIAECLARPMLAKRLVTNLSAHDQKLQSELKRQTESWQRTAETVAPNLMPAARANYSLPTISSGSGCADNSWTATSITNAPAARSSQTAVWTGSEMIVWGGYGGTYLNTGGRYDPSTDTWVAISTMNAPAPRGGNTAVWTGSEMIVWGGDNGQSVNTGGRYNPANDTWTATTTTNAPLGRIFHTAVWTGSEMLVWAGWNEIELRTGGRYNPGTDSWAATSITNAPSARFDHTAVWTGNEMVVWAGWNGSNSFNTGGRYNPSTDSWAATSTTNAPTARYDHTAVWTGNEMIVWGGRNAGNYFNTGGKYNPSTDNWAATSTTNAPGARFSHTAVWTGSHMIVWGGTNMQKQFNTGGRYNPGTDNWMATATTNAPERRAYHTAVWSGSEMIVWGGLNDLGPFFLNTGGKYCAQPSPTSTPTPTPTPTATATAGEACRVALPTPCDDVSFPRTDFFVFVSCPVGSCSPGGLTVNGVPAESCTVTGIQSVSFHFNTSPVVPGTNTLHVGSAAISCGSQCFFRPVEEFTCTFTYTPGTPTPTPTATPTASPTERFTPIPRPRPTPAPHP